MEHYLHTSACLVLASVVVASGRLPPKLNCVIQNLMAGLRKEPCRCEKGLGQREPASTTRVKAMKIMFWLWLRVLAVVYMACQTHVVSLSPYVLKEFRQCYHAVHQRIVLRHAAYLAQWLFMWLFFFLCLLAGSCRLLLRQRWLS
jgi:hypothetical protein